MKRLKNSKRTGGVTLILEKGGKERFRHKGLLVTSVCVYADGRVYITAPTAGENHIWEVTADQLPKHIQDAMARSSSRRAAGRRPRDRPA